MQQDGAAARAEGFARTDLLRALFHGNEGDVHDADGADEERKPRDKQSRESDTLLDRIELSFEGALFVDVEIIAFAGELGAHAAHRTRELFARVGHARFVGDLHANLGATAHAEIFPKRLER